MQPIRHLSASVTILLLLASPAAGGGELIFADGFESGDTSVWSSRH